MHVRIRLLVHRRGNRLGVEKAVPFLGLILALALVFITPPLRALDFPGPEPGPAQSAADSNGVFTLKNAVLEMSWSFSNSRLQPLSFSNKLSGEFWEQTDSELFRLGDAAAAGGLNLRASDFVVISGPQLQTSKPASQSSRIGDTLPGQELVAQLCHRTTGIEVSWRAVLRDEANYVRQFMIVTSTNRSEALTAVQVLDCAMATPPVAFGAVPGSPAVAGQNFMGGENPFCSQVISSNRVSFNLPCALPLGPDASYSFSSVLGVFPQGQTRRAFLYYLERERARPYWQLLHYNSFFDLLFDVNEKDMLQVVDICERELHQKRGVRLESYLMDDGWDDSTQGFWAIDTNSFPNRFDLLSATVRSNGTHLGIWISPLCGYEPARPIRVKAGIKEGLFPNAPDLSNAAYYRWWTNRCSFLMLSNSVNYFKWDNAGDGVNPHFMACLRAAEDLRRYSSNLFLNVTVGTWPSPFWLQQIDSTWRGVGDVDFSGIGEQRERWITFRDTVVYQQIVQRAPLYPLTALMLHGIVDAKFVGGLNSPTSDLRHEARSFFGSGVALQELYITPSLLSASNWDQLADGANWARTNASVLVDSHWIGGDPSQLQIYGWAAWNQQKGVITLRNPSDQPQMIGLDAGTLFQLPSNAPTVYSVSPAYSDQRPTVTALQAGCQVTVKLQPFEVLVFDALPCTNASTNIAIPVIITTQPASQTRYLGTPATFFVNALGSAPLSYRWQFNGSNIVAATNASLVLDSTTYDEAGLYSVIVSNAGGCETSSVASLTVRTPSPYTAALQADHPLAYWRLNESNGPTIHDAFGEHNGLAFGSMVFRQPGALTNDLNAALYFSGQPGTKIDVPYAAELNPPAFTIECWAKVNGGIDSNRSPLTCRSGDPLGGYLFYAAANNHWEFWIGSGSNWQELVGPAVVRGKWTFLAGTFDGTNQSFYVDGQLVGRVASKFVPNGTQPLRIGAGATEGTGDFYFPGSVDEVALFDYALSATQLQEHYAASAKPSVISIERTGMKLRLAWPEGPLEQADTLTGPWTPLTNAFSPWIVNPAPEAQFYRIH